MIRRPFALRLKPGSFPEYKQRRDNIWPEFVEESERSGIASMISFESDPTIFIYSEIQAEKAWEKLWESDVHYRWAELFEHLIDIVDGKPAAGELRVIFHLETGQNAQLLAAPAGVPGSQGGWKPE